MAVESDIPYGAFNFQVVFDAVGNLPAIDAGFSDVTGLGNEINFSDYREGDDPENVVRKIPNTNKTDEVTFKRGMVGKVEIFEWFRAVRDGEYLPRRITITLRDGARSPVLSMSLRNAQPRKWIGPALAAKGGGEVSIEELHVVHEGIEYE